MPDDREVMGMRHRDQVFSVAFSPDGKCLASGSWDSTARLWKVPSGDEAEQLEHGNTVKSVAFSPGGKYLATGIWDCTNCNTVRLWEVDSSCEAALMRRQIEHGKSVESVSFSPGGKYLATGSWDNTIRLWEVDSDENGEKIRMVKEMKHERNGLHQRGIYDVAFSPNGRYLATSAEDYTVRVWEVPTGREVWHTPKIEGGVYGLSFSSNGKYLAMANKAVGAEFGTAQVWEVANREKVMQVSHEGGVNDVAFSPGSRYLASAGADGTARVWEVPSGREVARVAQEPVESVSFSPGGRYLATAGSYNTAQIHLWQPDTLIADACARLTRNLTRQEWERYLGDEPYRKTCTNLPDTT